MSTQNKRTLARYALTRGCLFLSLLLSTALLSACNEKTNLTPPPSATNDVSNSPVDTPPQDNRSYVSFELPNRLKVILVSDPSAERAAAALAVGVGSSNDPGDSPGLAHFVEHMLFLGSERYPEPHGFQQFMSQSGGTFNAFTSADQTNFFFEVGAGNLPSALDRFSQFFIAPTFNEKYVDSELKVVDAEYQMLKENEGWAGVSLMKRAINPAHPFSRFEVGNRESLAGDNSNSLRERAMNFYQSNYSANNMTLVVLGKEPVSQLKVMVEKNFSRIKRADNKEQDRPPSLFTASKHPQLLVMGLKNPLPQMMLSFSVPPFFTHYKVKPEEFIANLLNENHDAGLGARLKEKGWINGVLTGSRLSAKHYATFDIQFALTEEGLKHYNEVIRATFEYLRIIKNVGIAERRYRHQQQISSEKFRLQEPDPAIVYVAELASNLQTYPVKDVYTGPRLMEKYDASIISEYLDYITPENAIVSLSGTGQTLSRTDEWSGLQYSLSPISVAMVDRWKEPGAVTGLSLPEVQAESRVVSIEIPLVEGSSESQIQASGPEVIEQSKGFTWWHRVDDKFLVPKTDTFLKLESPAIEASPKTTATKGVYAMMITEALLPLSSQFREAGVLYDIRPTTQGISLSLSGKTQPQSVLLDQVLKVIIDAQLTEQNFSIAKQNLTSMYQRYYQSQPIDKVMNAITTTLDPLTWELDSLASELELITLDDVRTFQAGFLSQLNVTGLTHGNLNKNQALQLSRQVKSALDTAKTGAAMPSYRVVNLSPGEGWLRTLNGDSTNTAVVLYNQLSDNTPSNSASMRLLGYLLQSELFNTLRTEHSMGYIVGAAPMPVFNVDGLAIFAQSPNQSAEEIQMELAAELKGMEARVSAMSDRDFKQAKVALLSFLMQEPNMKARSDAYWAGIMLKQPAFLQKDQLVEALEHLNKDEFLAFCNRFLPEDTRSELVIYSQPHTKSMSTLNKFKIISELSSFRRSANYVTK
ncbi:insulinase family protein [Alkalimarinus coralli]|uniref:insulinase family protein n=1 Tax=Alkalimarinus coralli TaxID=2935863 RepID=UPI00202B1354|nr:insulinase family protein [Alkalimarinus coralli]